MSEEESLLEYETEVIEHQPTVVEPIPVHVCGTVATIGTVGQNATCETFVLTQANPVAQILPQDPLRVAAWILPKPDNDVVLCHSLQQAQDPANLVTGLANANGAIVLAALTAPVPVPGTQRMWVVANTYPTRVSVVTERRTA